MFFTNYDSRKSQEMLANPWAALVFYWREVHRSVRVLGRVEKVSREESWEYFKSRPVGSRLGAWASRQSSVVGEGEVQMRLKEVQERFRVGEGVEDGDVPLPEFWGGWRVDPTCVYSIFYAGKFISYNRSEVEFWAGKPSRLHDRVRYQLVDSQWRIERLAP